MLFRSAILATEKLKGVAAGQPDHAFYTGKIAAAQYYARNVLPAVELRGKQMLDEDKTPLEITDDSFATL